MGNKKHSFSKVIYFNHFVIEFTLRINGKLNIFIHHFVCYSMDSLKKIIII